MLKASELFERLHNEGRECKMRLEGIAKKDGTDMRRHGSHRSAYVLRGDFPNLPTKCLCARGLMATAIREPSADHDEIAKAFNIPENILFEMELRYEGNCEHSPHTFGQLAEWLKPKGY